MKYNISKPPFCAARPIATVYNTEYCNDKRYASFRNLLRTGNLYSEDFCYHEVPEKLDPFDEEAFRASPMDFFVVCTDLHLSLIHIAVAIRWHMGGFDDAVRGGSFAMSGAFEKYPLAVKLHIADLEATYLLEQRGE